MPSLFDQLELGDILLRNRVILAPMTRSRADGQGVVNSSARKYYAMRSDAGLLITEGINVGPMSAAFDRTPGIWTEAQVDAWREVVDDVHRAGGRIVAQLWHGGRASARGLLNGRHPLSPSGVNDDLESLQVWALLANGSYVRIAATDSKEMTSEEIEGAIAEFRDAAANAMRAGFDGVEVHGANGYLIHEFLSPTLNRRTDRFGGSIDARSLLVREIISAISDVVPSGRIGLRLSPLAHYNNVRDPAPIETYASLIAWINECALAYVHIADTNAWVGEPDLRQLIEMFRPAYRGSLILNGGIAPNHAEELVNSGRADAVAFGRLFLANPDLLQRIRLGGPYNAAFKEGAYGGDDHGYLDYPRLDDVAETAPEKSTS
ncbi:alkene reductase [Tardiphaga alba]|uniref:Alkene reductase n=1 Tax=Tardiphaga alba TaxID=340268 RepID=A0ABX8A4B5_9BRAD|nr:alkene reductase [Tardiphaga alba]QUS38047.1 alkene reductase [Tardiphaga alba]